MSNFLVRKVAVLGAGVMGAQIAAHCINARIPVVLFDLPAKEGPKNGIVLRALENLKKLSPAPLGQADDVRYIGVANYEEDLEQLRACDLVIEAIAERIDWKHDLYKKVAPYIGPSAIFASNTSGLSINALAEGFDAGLKARFCGIHFFNPPRYMHLVELIPTSTTEPAILDRLETFLTTSLGKGVVRAFDTPNFIGNRVGIFSILATFVEAEKYALSYDVVDDLTGAKLGRAKSGTFRTADVVGLDTLAHVIATMRDHLKDDPFYPIYAVPAVLGALLEKGALGQKSGAGFYKKAGKDILRLDPATGDYVASGKKADELVVRILKKKDPAERMKLLRESSHPQAQFLWAIFRDTFHYIAVHLKDIAESARDVDFALRFGFGQERGPFESWQAAGWKEVAAWVQEDIDAGKALSKAPLPAWVFDGRTGVHGANGSYSALLGRDVPRSSLPVYRRQIDPARLVGEPSGDLGTTVFEDDSVRLFSIDGDVLVFSMKTKVHAIGPGVIAGLTLALEKAESEYEGLVVWSPEEPFSVGADLQAMLPLFMSGGVKAIGPEVKKLQDALMALRYAQVPTVAAVSGMALGGGCELALACAKRVAHLESYIGLVEVGVGLIPSGGGLTYAARRAAEEQSQVPDTYLLDFVKKYFLNAATAAVSKSALEARRMGYLLTDDEIVLHRHELLGRAIAAARALAALPYRAPLKPSGIGVAGRSGIATITAQLVNMRDGGFISPHDFHLGRTIAEIMCGGDVDPGSLVDEQWLLESERRAFVSLLSHPKTQERIMGMMQTGKPVRN
ncbi:MAG: 3-hydroxyacyl-CoA dehydrogenase/enoyl-CoA hydratase family protein [Burkholderiaceae bacterium]